MLTYILYQSDRKPICTEAEIQKILASCKKNNSHKDITGMLIYTNNKFMQMLEGDYNAITELYNKIKQDQRHHHVVSISLGMLKKRNFPGWAMALKEVDKKHLTIISEMAQEEKATFSDIMNEGAHAEASKALAYFRKIVS